MLATFWHQPEICIIRSGGEIRDARTPTFFTLNLRITLEHLNTLRWSFYYAYKSGQVFIWCAIAEDRWWTILNLFPITHVEEKKWFLKSNLLCVFLKVIFSVCTCLCVPDFSSRSNDRDFGLVSKCSQHLPLQLNRARFLEMLFVYFLGKFFEKIGKIRANFSENFFFLNQWNRK